MAQITEIVGLPKVLANLKAHALKLELGCARGVKVAGLHLQRESQKVVPVDYGNLKASAFTRTSGEGFNTEARIGYTAEYAIYVHENVAMKLKGQPRPKPHKGKYWDPQGRAQAKFLEEPARRLAPELLHIIKAHMTIL